MFLLFVHRICFIVARATAIVGVPFAILLVGGEVHETGLTVLWFMRLVMAIFLAIVPILLFKYVIRITCPRCGEKLDREVVGAGNYDCDNCGSSYS